MPTLAMRTRGPVSDGQIWAVPVDAAKFESGMARSSGVSWRASSRIRPAPPESLHQRGGVVEPIYKVLNFPTLNTQTAATRNLVTDQPETSPCARAPCITGGTLVFKCHTASSSGDHLTV